MKKENIKKVVLAYSGGLDTSIIIPWLKENYNNCEVIAVSGDVGQGTELDGLEEKAKATGASKLYVLDLKKDFVENYIFPTLKFGAKYEDYLLGTSFARPCIAKALADIAIKEGADAICHGCTGKGNDQVRFELTLKALCPDMAIIAPWREWDIKSRDEEIDYAEAHHIPLKINRETNYSKDKNLWHLSHEGLDLESPANEPQYNKPGFLELGVSPEQAPDTPTYITLHFEKGIPTAVDGKEMESVELVEYLNKLGGANGIGLLDIVENRLVGIVTFDDAMDVIAEEHQEDLQIAGVGSGDSASDDSTNVLSWFVHRQYWVVVWGIASCIMATVLGTALGSAHLVVFPMCAMPLVLLAASRMVSFVKNYLLEYDGHDDEPKPYLGFFFQSTGMGLILSLVTYLCAQLVRTAAFPDAPMFEEQLFTGCFNIAAIICLVGNMSAVIYLMVLFWRDEHDLNTSGTAMNVIAVMISCVAYCAAAVLLTMSVMG